jgi:flagellar protein FliT
MSKHSAAKTLIAQTTLTAAPAPTAPTTTMNTHLLSYYEAIEQASADMLNAARTGNWDEVVKLEGACVLLISQLKHAATQQHLGTEETQLKSHIMQRILLNDAEIRHLAEPWLEDLDHLMKGKSKTVH